MSAELPQMKIRLPLDLKAKIQELSVKNNRSMNAEIVFMLEQSLSGNNKAYDKYEVFEIVKQAIESYTDLVKNNHTSKNTKNSDS